MRRLLLAVAMSIAGLHCAMAAEWFIEAHYPDQAALNRAAAKFQHVSVDAERRTLRVDTDEDGIVALEDAGLTVTIDAAGTARLRGFYATMQEALQSGVAQRTEGGYPSIPGYACYRTLEGSYQTMDDLAAAQPGLAEAYEIGPSWEQTQGSGGHEMRVLRITHLATAAADPDRPKFVAFGSIHAREYTPAELLTRMAEWLVSGYGVDPQATWLVDHVDFRLVLQANPDGRKKAESGILWRKNTNTVDGDCPGIPDAFSQPGIDLNRNFPFHWNTTGGSGSSGFRCDQTYRGPSAGSEPETQNVVRYVAGTPGAGGYAGGALPDRRNGNLTGPAPNDYAGLFFDVHSYSQLVLWSWGDTYTASPNDGALRSLGRRLAWFNHYTPQASVELYPTDGTTIDTFYGALGTPSYTIELGVDFFESCSTFQNTTYPKNFAALKYAARAAAAPYKLPSGPDVTALSASAPITGAGGLYTTLTATVDDTPYSQSNGSQATYAIQGANAYIDTLPWQAGAVPIALAATDGTFNGKTETVQGNIPLSGLAPGRHLVYVQGINALAGGTPGTPNAVFVDVKGAATIEVTSIAGDGGTIDPEGMQSVPAGTSLTFDVTPLIGRHVDTVSGCPGNFVPPRYTTAALYQDCTLTATFAIDQHTIGGNVLGLTGNGLVLRLNDRSDLAIDPASTTFVFPNPLDYGSMYEVTVGAQPSHPARVCTVINGSGTVAADVDHVIVRCEVDSSGLIFANGFEPGDGD